MTRLLKGKVLVFFISDVAVLVVAFWGAYELRLGPLRQYLVQLIQPMTTYLIPGMIVVTACVMSMTLANCYQDRRYLSRLESYASIVKAMTYGILLSFGLSFFLKAHSYSRSVLALFWALGTVGLVFERAFWHYIVKKLRNKGLDCLSVAILGLRGYEKRVKGIVRKFPEMGYSPVVGMNIGTGRVEKHLRRLADLLQKGKIQVVLLGAPAHDYHRIVPYLAWCEENYIPHHQISSVFDVFHGENAAVQDPARGGSRSLYAIGKRMFDELAALLLFVLALPLWIVIAVAIRLDSPGPIFFVQDRVGRNGRIFGLYKFRTMYAHAPRYAPTVRSARDRRVTWVGEFLRRTSLDELPQLLNVLKGDMSLVGPRPEMPFMVKRNSPTYQKRLMVPPGITGLWQAIARHEPLEESLRYDLYYIKHRSFLFDLVILARTVFTVLGGRGAS